ncbi:MAG TPA: 3'(2'),5'-bisphosphate nucleotidase CysQ [Bacilli bacterium]|nr:3'(2'),5'-bisphosphate nucleotidase CysQ [Bacilli bacterium]
MYKKELEHSIKAARIAGELIMSYYKKDFAIETKSDNSPVTEADEAADLAIREYLAPKFPTYSFLTEEGVDDLDRLKNSHVFIVDPIDGTRHFINRDGEFTVNIALSVNGEVKVGVIYVPVTEELYYAVKGGGAYRLTSDNIAHKIQVNDKTENLTISCSIHHQHVTEIAFIERNKDIISNTVSLGSTLKAIKIAEGEIEMFYRGSRGTKEWDVAASDIIVTEAGGLFINHDGTKIIYNKQDVNNYNGYLIVNRKENIRQ